MPKIVQNLQKWPKLQQQKKAKNFNKAREKKQNKKTAVKN